MGKANTTIAWTLFWLGATSPIWVAGIAMLLFDQENGNLANVFFGSIFLAFVALTGRGIYLLPCPRKEKWTWWFIALMLWGTSLATILFGIASLGDLGR